MPEASPLGQALGHRTGRALTEPTACGADLPPGSLCSIHGPPQGRNAARHVQRGGRGPSFHKKSARLCAPSVCTNKNAAEKLTGQRDTDLRIMLSAQPAEFHSLGVCPNCQAEEMGYRARERSGEQHGSFGEGGDIQRVCRRYR